MGQWLLENKPQVLLERIVSQGQRILELEQQLKEQQQQNEYLQQQISELERAGKRQAAPFRRRPSKRQSNPKRPGRKANHPGQWRHRPPEEAVSERIEVALEQCPHCAGELKACHHQVLEQTILEIPPVKPQVIRLRTYRQTCPHCQQLAESHHRLQVSKARGAASTHLGPRSLGIAASLHHQLGLSMRKSCQALEELLGLKLSPGGLSQALQRIAHQLTPEYDQLLETLRQAPVMHMDETGWWVAGPGYWLWVVTNAQGTYYRVVPARNRETAKALIGQNFDGVLVTDCLNIYDGLEPPQQKCYAHHLKALAEALATPSGQKSLYLLELRALLHGALLLKKAKHWLEPKTSQQWRQALETRAEQLLTTPRGDPDDAQCRLEERLRQRLSKQQEHLFTFLDYPAVEATNNQAERQLRPAVISRKISCGNKTEAGAATWQVLASLAATCAQKGESFIQKVADAMVLHPSPQGQ